MSKAKLFLLIAVLINLLNFAAVGFFVYRNSRSDNPKEIRLPFQFSKTPTEKNLYNPT